ncbi:hypothetical protein AMTR_s00093p00150390, partial [Amborella trichopoda]
MHESACIRRVRSGRWLVLDGKGIARCGNLWKIDTHDSRRGGRARQLWHRGAH